MWPSTPSAWPEIIAPSGDARNATVAATASALTKTIYTDLAPTLHGAAMRNVLAHLIDLQSRAKVARTGTGPLSVATFQLA